MTNLNTFYKDPIQRPSHGLSDHLSVEVQPRDRSHLPKQRRTIKSRNLKPSNRLAMRTYLQNVDINAQIGSVHTGVEKVSDLELIFQVGMDFVMPLRSKTIYSGEPPWINTKLKDLIKRRQRALAQGNLTLFRFLRNRVNRERKVCRTRYYDTKVAYLKDCKPSLWWREVKKLSGLSSSSKSDLINLVQHLEETSDGVHLAKMINQAFLSSMSNFDPLSSDYEPQQDDIHVVPYQVSRDSVFVKLSSLNSRKATGPDGIPAWLIKENADLLADPISEIINCSFCECRLPPVWKTADIVPIPKQKPVQEVNKDLRPISLTPVLAKVAEEFVVEEHVRPAVVKKIKGHQFGCIPKSSTTQALLSMVHSWTKHTDGTGATVRVVLFDYKKAFDLIDHQILVSKLTALDLSYPILCWIIDFLKNRKQRVKLGQDCKSEWGDIPAGVPQGTKLGPWLFIVMIDDIDVTNAELWKYVDDTTISESIVKSQASRIQESVNEIVMKSSENKLQLNERKCKEMRISFAKTAADFNPIVINEKAIEMVSNVKLLGLNISNDLKWNCHVAEISRKVSTRLYFLKQLKRAGVATKELVTFYTTCIRPIMEYACPVYHNSLPNYLSEELESLQKRAMRIVYPFIDYYEALELAKLDTASKRRHTQTTVVFQEISANPGHKLHKFLPKLNQSNFNLRTARKYHVPTCKTNRLQNTFFYSNCI